VPFYPILPRLFIFASATIVLASWIPGLPLARLGWLMFRMSALGRAPCVNGDQELE
jgi:hypothetical protein